MSFVNISVNVNVSVRVNDSVRVYAKNSFANLIIIFLITA